METLSNITVKKTTRSKIEEADFNEFEFGQYTSDHMLICDYADRQWQDAQIVPYANLVMDPLTLALHYGQTVFEGMKAFRMKDGRISIFRIEKHYHRFARSLERMCMAVPPKDVFIEGMKELIRTDAAWVPSKKNTALYIRPFVYASEPKMGVKISEQYRFLICTGPVPELYARPIKVKVETNYIRAAKGGTGFAKCGGNYGAAFYPLQLARKEGYDQVLWTDGRDNKFIEESGTMNAFFVIDDQLVTPPVSDSILDGVTRDSLLTLANDQGYTTAERPVAVEELEKAFAEKRITEAFGAGTAAVVSPIQTIHINGIDYNLSSYGPDNILFQVKQRLDKIRAGIEEDQYGWNTII